MKTAISFGVIPPYDLTPRNRYKSADAQKNKVNKYAKENGYLVVGEVYDFMDGRLLFESELFERLCNEIVNKKADAVIIAKSDIVFNSAFDCEMVITKFLRNRYKLISSSEGIMADDWFTIAKYESEVANE